MIRRRATSQDAIDRLSGRDSILQPADDRVIELAHRRELIEVKAQRDERVGRPRRRERADDVGLREAEVRTQDADDGMRRPVEWR